MDVLDERDERPRRCKRIEELAECPADPVRAESRVGHPDCGCDGVADSCLNDGVHLLFRRRQRVLVVNGSSLSDNLSERPIRNAFAIREAATRVDACVRAEMRTKLRSESRLA